MDTRLKVQFDDHPPSNRVSLNVSLLYCLNIMPRCEMKFCLLLLEIQIIYRYKNQLSTVQIHFMNSRVHLIITFVKVLR